MNQIKLMFTALTLALTLTANAASQRHQHTPRKVNTTIVVNADSSSVGISAFSDTTSIDQAADSGNIDSVIAKSGNNYQVSMNLASDHSKSIKDSVFEGLSDMLWLVCIVFIIFIVAPIGILIVILVFIYKNRQQKLRMAEMAIKNGQPIPQETTQPTVINEDLWTKGVRQLCVGIGLIILFSIIKVSLGIGIGALVACIGGGKLVIARRQNKGGQDTQAQQGEQNKEAQQSGEKNQ